MGSRIFIGVGANLEPEISIVRALELLLQQVSVRACSLFYRTVPLGCQRQPSYYNGVWEVDTSVTAVTFKFEVLRGIESRLGRKRGDDPYASRPVDLDLLLYGDSLSENPDLLLPDPDIYTRNFVAIPLAELAPDLILPDTLIPIKDIVSGMDRQGMEVLPDFSDHLRGFLVR